MSLLAKVGTRRGKIAPSKLSLSELDKHHFEPDLEIQLQAIEAGCGVLRSQEINRTEFAVTAGARRCRSHPRQRVRG